MAISRTAIWTSFIVYTMFVIIQNIVSIAGYIKHDYKVSRYLYNFYMYFLPFSYDSRFQFCVFQIAFRSLTKRPQAPSRVAPAKREGNMAARMVGERCFGIVSNITRAGIPYRISAT